jgi:hypothetical protein
LNAFKNVREKLESGGKYSKTEMATVKVDV